MVDYIIRTSKELATKEFNEKYSKADDLMQCIVCGGTGKITITVMKFNDKTTESKTKISCIDCNGQGIITKQKAFNILVDKNVWCKCDNPGEMGGYRIADGRKLGNRDTYVCHECHMVQQFG